MDSYMLEVYDFRDTVELHLKYQRNLFEAATVRRHLGYLEMLIAAIAEDPGRRIDEYDCLPEQEARLLLDGFKRYRRGVFKTVLRSRTVRSSGGPSAGQHGF